MTHMTPQELLHFAGTHDYRNINETMRVIMDAATEIERLRDANAELIEALIDILPELESVGPLEKFEKARAVIAKAHTI